jgi:hypothetical protein
MRDHILKTGYMPLGIRPNDAVTLCGSMIRSMPLLVRKPS